MAITIYNHFMTHSGAAPDLHPDGLVMAGAYFPIEIHVPREIADALAQAGRPIPPPQTGLAIIDTGATMTAVNEAALAALALSPVNLVQLGTANGLVTQGVYAARLYFPTVDWSLDIEQVIAANLSGQVVPLNPIQPLVCLIGRNTLRDWVVVWNGPGGFWTVAVG